MPGYPCCCEMPCGWACGFGNNLFACCWPPRDEFPNNLTDTPVELEVDIGEPPVWTPSADARFIINNADYDQFSGTYIFPRDATKICKYPRGGIFADKLIDPRGSITFETPAGQCTGTLYQEMVIEPVTASSREPDLSVFPPTDTTWCYEFRIRFFTQWNTGCWWIFDGTGIHVGRIIRYRSKVFDMHDLTANPDETVRRCEPLLKNMKLFSSGDLADENYWAIRGGGPATEVVWPVTGVPNDSEEITIEPIWWVP